nr:actin-related protein 9 isoform X2 [Ipomoea batatas]
MSEQTTSRRRIASRLRNRARPATAASVATRHRRHLSLPSPPPLSEQTTSAAVHTFRAYVKLQNVGTEDYYCRFEYKAATGAFYLNTDPSNRISISIQLGHNNKVLEDLQTIWDWILTEKLNIPLHLRHMYAAILVVPETFDNREELAKVELAAAIAAITSEKASQIEKMAELKEI